MYQRILIPTDGSETAKYALEHGLQLAKKFGATVTILHIVENPLTAGYTAPQTLPYAAELYQDLLDAGKEILDNARLHAEEMGVTAEVTLLENNDPVSAITEAEKTHDLVVMGTHGRSGFNRWMFGSVAEGALRRSQKPFLVLRQPN